MSFGAMRTGLGGEISLGARSADSLYGLRGLLLYEHVRGGLPCGASTLRWQETLLSGQATDSHNVALFPFQAFGWSVW